MARPVFVDTSFLFAGFSPEDRHHHDATRQVEQIGERRLVTTNYVRGETWTLVRRRKTHPHAVAALDAIRATRRLKVADVDADLEEQALDWLRRHDESEYSFVDATSFAFMRANRITEALAFDGDFAAAGFVELRP